MTPLPATLRQQQNTVLSLVTLFVLALLCLQLWLLVETLETAFPPATASSLPGVIVSAVCALVGWWLWRLLQRRS
jgi:protein-S-isoprenylcysteine O-methyltransferase Ste14